MTTTPPQAEALTTPLADLRHLYLAGPRNAGKSSFLNLLFEKEVAIVSPIPGTTTDPVTRKIELGPLGPVALTDTAGVDDEGELGLLRVEKTLDRLRGSDLVIFLTPLSRTLTPQEEALEAFLLKKGGPILYVATHSDQTPELSKQTWLQARQSLPLDALTGQGLPAIKERLFQLAGALENEMPPLEGLIGEGDLVLLVTPIDLAAPQGRLILPQVKTIRDALDKDAAVLVCKERELRHFYAMLRTPPKLVVCDSQAFSSVAADLPPHQPLTSFSLLFARIKGDLNLMEQGLRVLESLGESSMGATSHEGRPVAGGPKKVMILESCNHHRQADDIATVKIPRLLHQLVSPQLEIVALRGMPTAQELQDVALVIHCGSCTLTRTRMQDRIKQLTQGGVAVTNFGMVLAWANGLIPRALTPLQE